MGVSYPSGESPGGATIAAMATLNTARLRELVDAAGRTPRSVSLDVGDNAYLVRDLLSGRSRSPRTDTLLKLAATLGVEPSELLTCQHVVGASVNGRVVIRPAAR